MQHQATSTVAHLLINLILTVLLRSQENLYCFHRFSFTCLPLSDGEMTNVSMT